MFFYQLFLTSGKSVFHFSIILHSFLLTTLLEGKIFCLISYFLSSQSKVHHANFHFTLFTLESIFTHTGFEIANSDQISLLSTEDHRSHSLHQQQSLEPHYLFFAR